MKTLKELLDLRHAKRTEVNSITGLAKKENRDLTAEEGAKVDAFLDEIENLDKDIDEARSATRSSRLGRLDNRSNPSDPPPLRDNPPPAPDLPDLRKYSVLRAIRCLSQRNGHLDGLELEVSQELAKRHGKDPQGFYMPWGLTLDTRRLPDYEQRDLNLSAGGGAVGVETAPTMIEILRKRSVLASVGAQILTGMVGDFEIPKQTGAGSAYWVTEGNAPTESTQAIGQVAFAPSTLGAFTDITRKFILQSSVDAEAFVRNDLLKVLALELDRVGMFGSGSGAQPEGVATNSSVQTVAIATDGGALTFAKVVELETKIAAQDADVDTMAYVTSAAGRGHMKTTVKVSAQASYLWENNQVNGYRAIASNQIPSNLTKGSGTGLTAVLFGNWADLIYAFWGAGVDVLVDPYTASTAGTVRIVTLQDVDLQLRRTESFAKCLDVAT